MNLWTWVSQRSIMIDLIVLYYVRCQVNIRVTSEINLLCASILSISDKAVCHYSCSLKFQTKMDYPALHSLKRVQATEKFWILADSRWYAPCLLDIISSNWCLHVSSIVFCHVVQLCLFVNSYDNPTIDLCIFTIKERLWTIRGW